MHIYIYMSRVEYLYYVEFIFLYLKRIAFCFELNLRVKEASLQENMSTSGVEGAELTWKSAEKWWEEIAKFMKNIQVQNGATKWR